LRAEFARGDGRVKRKEDERRRNIQPSETLFVVNFHEETTKKEDLEMLFGPFGELVRIDMKVRQVTCLLLEYCLVFWQQASCST
jgi:splicing factor, arginine/serine-rich 4/5/6